MQMRPIGGLSVHRRCSLPRCTPLRTSPTSIPAPVSAHAPLACPAAAVGIDLGTTSSSVAVIGTDGTARTVEDAAGRAVIPSVVHFAPDGSVLVGQAAVDAAASNPGSTFYSVKRLIGRAFDRVQDLLPGLTFQVVPGADGSTLLSLAGGEGGRIAASEAAGATSPQGSAATSTSSGGATGTCSQQEQQRFCGQQRDTATAADIAAPLPLVPTTLLVAPEQVSAHILRHLLQRAQAHLGSTHALREAVVTVPAYFNLAQRQATVRAARLAGLEKVTLLQEPVAAAMAYGFGKPTDWDTILVFDLGGGTLDLSLLEAFEGIMEVVATGGDARLGGDDFTDACVAAVRARLPEELLLEQERRGSNAGFRLALRRAAEVAKEGLSMHEDVDVHVDFPGSSSATASATASAAASATAPAPVTVRLTRSQLEDACRDLVVRLWPPLESLAKEARLQLGGRHPGTLPPWQQQQGEGRERGPQQPGADQGSGGSGSVGSAGREAAAASVSEAAAPLRIKGREFEVFASNATGGAATTNGSHANGAADKYAAPPRRLTGVVLVGAATRMPGVRSFIEHVTGLTPAPGVDPEAAVALGAAIHAGVMQGSSSGVELTDGSYVAELHNRASAMLAEWQP